MSFFSNTRKKYNLCSVFPSAAWLVHDGVNPNMVHQLRMHHYQIQSWEYFRRIKAPRGGCDARAGQCTKEYFDQNNFKQEVDNTLYEKRGPAFLDGLPKIRPRWPADAAVPATPEALTAWLMLDRPNTVRSPEDLKTHEARHGLQDL